MDSNVVNIADKIIPMEEESTTVESLTNDSNDLDSAEAVAPVEHPEAVIEAILFSMGDSVSINKISSVIGYTKDATLKLLQNIKDRMDKDSSRGTTLTFLDENVQMCTKSEMFEHIIKVAKSPKNFSLTDVVLETLSIIAFKQPVTRLEIEKIRGVSCEHSINKLLEYDLIQELGRMDAPGRPILFGTTEQFLRSFGVKSLDELPDVSPERLEEFKEEAAKEVQLELKI